MQETRGGAEPGKERMLAGDKLDSGHTDFTFLVWDGGGEPSRQLEMLGERLDNDLGVGHREVRVDAAG